MMTRLNESFAHLCALFEAKIVIWAIIILSSWCAFAATLTVDSKASGGTPGTYATLQKAVDVAAGGDEIVVKGGEYYGRTRILKVYEKPLTIPRRSRKAIC